MYHLNGTPVPPITFSLGHFSLQALAGDSCTSKGAVQTERGRGSEVRKMAAKKREALKTVAVFRVCSAWLD